MIDVDHINARKEILITEIQNLQDRLTELDKEKSTLIGNINAMRGALQQCDYFISVLEEEKKENAIKKAKKEKPKRKLAPAVAAAVDLEIPVGQSVNELTEGGLKR